MQKNNRILDILSQYESNEDEESFKKPSPKRPKSLTKVVEKCIHLSWKHKSEAHVPFVLMKTGQKHPIFLTRYNLDSYVGSKNGPQQRNAGELGCGNWFFG